MDERPLGGRARLVLERRLYYTKIGIGTPSQDHYVYVDTGSDILWVTCAGCTACPKKSGLGANKNGPDPGCTSGVHCGYYLQYGDGSSTAGYFVRDIIKYDQLSGNLTTTKRQLKCYIWMGNLDEPSTTLDGILGFEQSSNNSMMSPDGGCLDR
ncbi:hypothetical protein IFM89_030512 [Coptis chinensis]|uniref:Peptidase A1 domain-containing protein n=1 Tax=Coptis chinensis TaxID=261450 RepID=A0A835HNE7_9MAGN|nr:hypothetical protein IFM89_030512 [Coptis chinensis]